MPDILRSNPLFGLGLNNFSVYYEKVTGKTNWGPHSFYVASIVETGLVGTALFGVFIAYLFARLWAARSVGHALAQRGDIAAARVIPLSWGLTAALAGTLASNLFYLTMSVLLRLCRRGLLPRAAGRLRPRVAFPAEDGAGRSASAVGARQLVEREAAAVARPPHGAPLRLVDQRRAEVRIREREPEARAAAASRPPRSTGRPSAAGRRVAAPARAARSPRSRRRPPGRR